MAAFLLASFYATMVAAGIIVQFLFELLGLEKTERNAKVEMASVHWNYTTYLNIVFLCLAAVLVWRFLRTNGLPMLRMMNEPAGAHSHAHQHHGHAHSH
jgi:hypothetical protein